MASGQSANETGPKPNWLDTRSPNHEWEKLLPMNERQFFMAKRAREAKSLSLFKDWRVRLFYAIVEIAPGEYAFRDGILSKYRKLLDEELKRYGLESKSYCRMNFAIRFAILGACHFFGRKCVPFGAYSILPSEPRTPFTKLPLEIQFMVLDQLPVYKADELIRTNFPHLIPIWVGSLGRRISKFMDDVCSRENLCYAGTQLKYRGAGVVREDIYRPRWINKHPDFRLPGSYGKGDDFEWNVVEDVAADEEPEEDDSEEEDSEDEDSDEEEDPRLRVSVPSCPSLAYCKSNLTTHFDNLLTIVKRENLWGQESRFTCTGQSWRDNERGIPEEWERIGERGRQEGYHDRFTQQQHRFAPQHHSGQKCAACLEEVQSMPVLLPFSASDTPDSDRKDKGTTKFIPTYQVLLLFADELELVLQSYDLIKRPCYLFTAHVEATSPPEAWFARHEPVKFIWYGIDAACFREVPWGEKLRCKHEDVPREWLNGRGTMELMFGKHGLGD